ncbi:MAG TPA: hypothetical protein EYO87_01630, partial [Paracoccus sp.]|nr:hypothetical protein [Paracoccus sp. (in: a-proteobacteria)]
MAASLPGAVELNVRLIAGISVFVQVRVPCLQIMSEFIDEMAHDFAQGLIAGGPGGHGPRQHRALTIRRAGLRRHFAQVRGGGLTAQCLGVL